MKERAQKIYDAWEEEYCLQRGFYEGRALSAALKELINQTQRCTTVGVVVMCPDILELCEELKKL